MGVDVLSKGDLLEGMMAGEEPLSFVFLAKGANKRSEAKVGKQVRSWWKDTEGGQPLGDFPLTGS